MARDDRSDAGDKSASTHEQASFQELVGDHGIRKLTSRQRNRASVSRQASSLHPDSLRGRRQSAEVDNTPALRSRTSDGRVEPVSPSQSLFFALHDIDQRLIARLKRGEIDWQEGLDLHGYTLEEARTEVESFLSDSLSRHLRCVLIVHGKAWSSTSGHPVIKSHVNAWLREWPQVLAFCSAIPVDGGTGAVYVLLRRHRDD